MRALRRCVLGAVALLASGCAYNDHFDNRVGRFDTAASQSRDGMILNNIIRASRGEPLSFFQLGKISGGNTATATMGLPSVVLGPHVQKAASAVASAAQAETIFGASAAGGAGYTGNSTQISGSTNFEVNPQESKEFYRGLLAEVEPRYLEFFIRQGVSRELLFYLFTERLVIDAPGQRPRELRNDPLDTANFPVFQTYVRLAMDYGLTTEPVPAKSGGKSRPGAKAAEKPGGKADASAAPAEKWRLCFDRLHMKENVPPAGNTPICGKHDADVSSDGRSVSFINGNGLGQRVKLTVQPRSAFAIFQFLGRIVAAGEAGRIQLHSEEAIDRGPLRDENLFVVNGDGDGGCYLAIEHDGDTYCVPKNGAANTKRILGLLAQLIALNTSIADIPITPTFRAIQ